MSSRAWLSVTSIGLMLIVLVVSASGSQAQGGRTDDKTLVLRLRAGPYHYWGKKPPGGAFREAIAAFGVPSSRGRAAPSSRTCTVRWESVGVDVEFDGATRCADSDLRRRSFWIGMRLWGAGWKTQAGLRVGDPVRRVHELYPKARYVSKPPAPPRWELLSRRSADFGRIPLLNADVGAGIVVAIDVPPGFVS